MEILNIKDLTFKYPQRDKNALTDISMKVNEGDFILLCGSSGSGKTTLLNLLHEDIKPHGDKTGIINFTNNAKVGIVTQNVENQIVSDTVWHNLSFALENENKAKNEIQQKIAEISEFFDISHLFHKNTYSLSGGEKQLVNLASVMVTDPDILLLDEPTSQLDPIAAKRFTDMIIKLNSEMNTTIIVSEHRTDDLWDYADCIYVIDEGKIVLSGNSDVINQEVSLSYLDIPQNVQLCRKLNFTDKIPKTIGGCRSFLQKTYKNEIKEISDSIQTHDTALHLKNIYFRYEKHSPDVLNNLELKANFGEILTVLGGNGSGKTTLLSVVGNVNKPYSGKVINHGRKTAVLPQNVKSVFTKDVLREDFALITKDFEEVCKKLSISHLLDYNPFDLSGGEAQRAALAKLLLLKPDIICLDEPTKGIDLTGKNAIKSILKDLAKKGVCIILVSHDIDFSAEISDKCAFFFDGKIVSTGTPREVFSKNKFYTTYASKISRHMYTNSVTIDDVVQLCKRNGSY